MLQSSGRAQETADKVSEQAKATAAETRDTLADRAQQVGGHLLIRSTNTALSSRYAGIC